MMARSDTALMLSFSVRLVLDQPVIMENKMFSASFCKDQLMGRAAKETVIISAL